MDRPFANKLTRGGTIQKHRPGGNQARGGSKPKLTPKEQKNKGTEKKEQKNKGKEKQRNRKTKEQKNKGTDKQRN